MENTEEQNNQLNNTNSEEQAGYIDVQNQNRVRQTQTNESEEKAGPDGLPKQMDGVSKATERDNVAIDLGLKDGDLDTGLTEEDENERDNSMI